ncbi:L-2-hydroxyglutarate dehydrogenase mitochondrial precursor [Microthyrium microscopicum]|uniref:L-2-hydroxyglutarate dehydrogenase, mitochondrial n=1 Tax=Microthyrium microscopicum TaxID=703497 RepID=A0A6A6UB06_9PEZI|nr:L-2-hydroxyglutarate dehydrogenase mitochondrial precursor [Microthyrium microscopicum]
MGSITRNAWRLQHQPTTKPIQRLFSTTLSQKSDFAHAVIGAGVVGIAAARQLQGRTGASTVLIEKHDAVGTETSSRNSEVIHAALYYGADSLKTKLCIRGRQELYKLCKEQGIPHRNTGKWVVAQNDTEFKELEKILDFSKQVGVPTHFLSKEEGKRREPDVQATAGILESPTTGIVDSHALMQYLLGDFEERGGVTALNSAITRVVPKQNGSGGWEIWTKSSATGADGGEESCITADTIVNSAGLYAVPLSNSILPEDRHITPYYAKGTYYSYTLSRPKTSTLIYPAPVPGHGGLGTHLTLDLGGRIRFGPDIQWVDSPTDYAASDEHLEAALADISRYLPTIDKSAITLDYTGIRPKLTRTSAIIAGQNFKDFIIRKEEGFEGFVNLLGIESPGLTSSLAIAEMVEELLCR